MGKLEHCATVKRREFLGLYTTWLDGYFRRMPLLCFSPSNKAGAIYSVSPFEDEEFSETPLSVEFAGLRTPDDFVGFAEKHGSLMGFCERKAEAVDPITQEELYAFFGLREGKKTRASTSSALRSRAAEGSVFREFLNDWTTAVRLMNLAFTLWRLIGEESLLDFVAESRISEDGTVGDCILQTSEKEKLHVKLYEEYSGLVTDIVDHTYYVETISCDPLFSGLNTLDSPRDRRIIILCSAPPKGEMEKELRSVLAEALDNLVNFHMEGIKFQAVGGKMVYTFESLLSYLWFDALASSNGLIEISTCDLCGKPFLRNNSGKRRRFCCNAHKVTFHNHSKKRKG